MQTTLDRKRPFGTVTPPWSGDNGELDRSVHYEQDGNQFDAHGIQVVAGKPAAKARRVAVPVVEAPIADDGNEAGSEDGEPLDAPAAASMTHTQVVPTGAIAGDLVMSPADLLSRASTMAYAKFVKEAKRILGATCPAGKPAIVGALEEVVKVFAEREAKRARRTPPPAPPAPQPQAAPAPYSAANGMTWGAQPGAKAAPGEIDLAAWGRGHKEYLFAEVRKALRAKYGRTVAGDNERADTVEFLIEAKVITAAEARKDV